MATHPDTLRRQWLMLQVIPRYPGKTTAAELAMRLRAERYDVTKRTVERDLIALSEDFPLVCDDRTKPFGWSWQKDAKQFSVPGMSPLQALVLSLAHSHMEPLLPAHLLQPLGPYFRQADSTLRSAFGKSGLRAWNQCVAVVQPTQPLLPPRVNDKALAVIHAALAEHRQIELRYRKPRADKAIKYTLHPLGLVYRGVLGYLVCTIGGYDDPRMLALHRVEVARPLDAPARALAGFDLQKYASSGVFGFMDNGPIKLVVRMEAPAAAHLHETPLSKDQVITDDKQGGWLRIAATVHDTSQLRWWLLAFGDQVEVMSPRPLRTAMAETVASSARLYDGGSAGDRQP
ncbi:MAG TPA: WYL domain-containing protein [Rhodanobacteraceae bacterium]|nr:WYL domain-containing protein [Rhodanobacteraceae bacterium]